jgi:hypothetical protein
VQSSEHSLSVGVSLVGSLSEPLCSLSVILLHMVACAVPNPEKTLSDIVSFVRGLLWPRHNRNVVLQKTLVCGVPEKTLSDGVSMVGTLSEPFNSLSVILRQTSACDEHHREDDLSVSVSLLGERAQKLKGSCVFAPFYGGGRVFKWASRYARCKTR